MIAALLGLASAFSWGLGDFVGGLASRKIGAYRTVLIAGSIGLVFILVISPFIHEPFPDSHTIIWSCGAGIVGTIGLIAIYEAMRRGRLSVVAPLSALLGAAVPVVAGVFIDGAPNQKIYLAFAVALIAVVLISIEKTPDDNSQNIRYYLHLPLISGLAFGFYFILMHEASQELVIGPIIVARLSGIIAIALFLLLKRESFRIESGNWRLLIINGFFDVSGNVFYILAGQAGRMDISAVLSSLYPGVTVLLAWLILKEKIQRSQWAGIALALVAIILMTTS